MEENLRIRENHWRRYDAGLGDVAEIVLPCVRPGDRHARQLYSILLRLELLRIGRDEWIEELRAENIGTAVHFVAVHLHSVYRRMLGHSRSDFPHAEFVSDRTVSLPLSARLSSGDIDDTARAVRKLTRHFRA